MKKNLAHYITICFALLCSELALADGEFLTINAEPVEYKHFEIYLSSNVYKDNDLKNIEIPTLELDLGVLPNFELDLSIPYFGHTPVSEENDEERSIWGIGDITTTLKYRFIQETKYCPQISFIPLFDWSTGKNDPGLRKILQLPISLQKSWENLTVTGNGGYYVSLESDTKNTFFADALLQLKLNNKWAIGSEVLFQQGTDTDYSDSTILNVGGSYNVTQNFSLLFSAGQSLTGKPTKIAYIGVHFVF